MSKPRKMMAVLGLALVFAPVTVSSSSVIVDELMEEEISVTRTIEEEIVEEVDFKSTIEEMHLEELKTEKEKPKEEIAKKEYIGKFRVSHYCLCNTCNYPYTHTIAANGEELIVDYSIAVDPDVIPLNSTVEIDGYKGSRKAMDTGGRIKGNRIDILVSDHEMAYELGVKNEVDVYIVGE